MKSLDARFRGHDEMPGSDRPASSCCYCDLRRAARQGWRSFAASGNFDDFYQIDPDLSKGKCDISN
jgi:hypothetical protein